MKKTLKIIGAILVFLLLVLLLLWKLDYIGIGVAQFENKEQIKTVNNSTYETIEYFVENHDFKNYKGKTIFFNSWATWCGGCKKEIPVLNTIHDKYRMDSNIVFLSYCSNAKANQIDSILKEDELSLNFQKINASNGLRMSLRKLAVEQNQLKDVDTTNDLVPMNLIIDTSGKIIYYNSSINKSDLNSIYNTIDHLLKK